MDPKSTLETVMHKDDIMTVCYDSKHLILWTGGHDGALFGWNTETGSTKYRLHEC
jgi:hypothetical protein